ncbi:MAG: hypothetical protein V1881_03710, partial [Candidatus Micrarchaeota archaeon]
REELDRAGFAVEDVFYWNFWGFWLTLLSKAIGKNPTGVANPISNALTAAWLPLEERVRLPLGVTLFAKARKGAAEK